MCGNTMKMCPQNVIVRADTETDESPAASMRRISGRASQERQALLWKNWEACRKSILRLARVS